VLCYKAPRRGRQQTVSMHLLISAATVFHISLYRTDFAAAAAARQPTMHSTPRRVSAHTHTMTADKLETMSCGIIQSGPKVTSL